MKAYAIIEPSRRFPGAWYWCVRTAEGEVYNDGDGDDSYEDAERNAEFHLREHLQKQDGTLTPTDEVF